MNCDIDDVVGLLNLKKDIAALDAEIRGLKIYENAPDATKLLQFGGEYVYGEGKEWSGPGLNPYIHIVLIL